MEGPRRMARQSLNLLFALLLLPGALPAQLVISPPSTTTAAGTWFSFKVTNNGANTTAVTWTVNGVANGNSTVGTMSSVRYNAPALPPSTRTVTVVATLISDPSRTATATVTINNPFVALASVSPPGLPASGPYTLTLNGSGFVPGAVATLNGVPLATTYVSSTRLTVTGSLRRGTEGWAAISVTNPQPGSSTSPELTLRIGGEKSTRYVVTRDAASRFLEQAAFGPDAYSLEQVRTLGFGQWIERQFDEPESPYMDPSTTGYSNGPVQARFYTNAVHGHDQLRQRVAFALHKIWVVSGNDINNPFRIIPYLRVLQQGAFGNYRDLMRAVTLNPAMGEYLDMRNNAKGDPSRGILPNENYARELMQLFTIGTYELNPDGTRKTDGQGNPIAIYDQKTVAELARIFTGWTYPTMPGGTPQRRNPAYYEGEMSPWEPDHDTGSKTLLNATVLPGGQSAGRDLDDALSNIFHHANVGPFVGKQLIQQLVTSNPSPAYVSRVAAVFDNNGAGLRGDLRAVIKAILLDPEARAADNGAAPDANQGHLKEPVLFLLQTLRAMNAMVNDSNTLASRGSAMGQNVFAPASVFSYFSPFYRVPGLGESGPEFQIHTRTSSVERMNQINTLLYGNYGAGAVVDLTPWASLAGDASKLTDALNERFLHGQMPASMKAEVAGAISGTSGTALDKAKAGLYVVLTSGYYWVAK